VHESKPAPFKKLKLSNYFVSFDYLIYSLKGF